MPDATAVVPGSSTDDAKYASNPKDFEADRTVGNNDQRHRFVFSGMYDTNGLAAGRAASGRADSRLGLQRDLHGVVRASRTRRGSATST